MSPRPSIPTEQLIHDRFVKAATNNCEPLDRLDQSIDRLDELVKQLTAKETTP